MISVTVHLEIIASARNATFKKCSASTRDLQILHLPSPHLTQSLIKRGVFNSKWTKVSLRLVGTPGTNSLHRLEGCRTGWSLCSILTMLGGIGWEETTKGTLLLLLCCFSRSVSSLGILLARSNHSCFSLLLVLSARCVSCAFSILQLVCYVYEDFILIVIK